MEAPFWWLIFASVSWTSLCVSHFVADLAGYLHHECLPHMNCLDTACLLFPALRTPASTPHRSHFCSLHLPSCTLCLFVSVCLAASYPHLLPFSLSFSSINVRMHYLTLHFCTRGVQVPLMSSLSSAPFHFALHWALGRRTLPQQKTVMGRWKKFPNVIKRMSALQSG